MTNFKKETGKDYSQKQFKIMWDALKKEWKAWKKLKGRDTGLGWNLIKRTVDASDDWWESRLKVGYLEKEWKAWKKLKGRDIGLGWNLIKRTVDASDDWWESRLKVVPEAQKFRISVATDDKAWTPSSGTFRSEFFEDVGNDIPEKNEEENVMSIVENSSGDESDDEREKKEILKRMECYNCSILEQVRNDSRYMPHFKDCIGAIDGIHIAAILPPNEEIPYIRRKCVPTQNVMAMCDFNTCFTFVMVGWEGSAHDIRIFLDAI
ncbi:hypothetical protein GOBAR_DD29358 [Gossypium barbadense]|nr:hypothetical protein GOBAR_DD29358 [Gossypium barbadense]